MQIAAEAKALLTYVPEISVVPLIGGTPMSKDVRALSGRVQLIVATPGRFEYHLKNNTEEIITRLKSINCFCLDEADRLLDVRTSLYPKKKGTHLL